ncbi:porin family protein [Algivirga pacifica]|uniref:Outer membrane protein beta-barrel domain-containing protein n=1 Tax=Algivirga pacifica TaxID=1162670 RepID=A0ABP9DF25_9BACT
MKKYLQLTGLLIGLLFGSSQASAQELTVVGGITLTNEYAQVYNTIVSENNLWKSGYHIGVEMDFPLVDDLAIQTGLQLQKRGYSTFDNIFGEEIKTSFSTHYLVVPLLARYQARINSQLQLQATFGPYLAMGLWGKMISEETLFDTKTIGKVYWGDTEDDDYTRPDMGFRLGTSLLYENYRIGISYDLGLYNTMPTAFIEDMKSQHRGWQLMMGYTLPGK